MGVFSGSTGGGLQGCGALYFFLHPSFCFCSVEWLIKKKKKAPVHSFLPHSRSGQYESRPGERRTKGHTCDTLRPFGIWVRIVSWSLKPGIHINASDSPWQLTHSQEDDLETANSCFIFKKVKRNVWILQKESSSLTTKTHACVHMWRGPGFWNRGVRGVFSFRAEKQKAAFICRYSAMCGRSTEERASLHTTTWLNNPSQGWDTWSHTNRELTQSTGSRLED